MKLTHRVACLSFTSWRLVLSVLNVLMLGAAIQSAPAADGHDRPNIIFIMADDLGFADLGCYGQRAIQTPHLDALAAEGLRFTSCYSGSPVCAPARSVLMTGQHTGHTTVRGNFGIGGVKGLGGGNGRVPLYDADVTVAEVLKTAGYVTGMTGKWGLGEPDTSGQPNNQGFDEWFGYLNQRRAHSYYVDFLWLNRERYPLPGNAEGQRQQYTHDLITDFALDFVTRHAREPFFLYVPYTIPHGAYEVPDLGFYRDKPWTKKERTYAAMVSRMDGDIGRLLALLDELDLKDRTLLFFCSDNGAANNWPGVFDSNGPLRGKKRDVYEGGIRVPMIVSGPGVPAGQVSDVPWSFADLLPTLADLVDANIPEGVDGMSVLPLLQGEAQDLSKRLLYWEFYEGGFKQAARRGPWKAVRLAHDRPLELYDLRVDIGEQENLARREPQLVAEFEASMEAAHVPSPHWPAPVDRVTTQEPTGRR